MTVETKKTFCPGCFYLFELASTVECPDQAIIPKDGEPSICLNCGRVLIFRDQGAEAATAEQIRELMSDPVLWSKVERLRELIERRGLLHQQAARLM